MKTCPNINSVAWQKLVDTVGEGMAWLIYEEKGTIPDILEQDTNLDELAYKEGLQDKQGTALGKTKSLEKKLKSKYLNLQVVETKRNGKFYYDLALIETLPKSSYIDMFKTSFPKSYALLENESIDLVESTEVKFSNNLIGHNNDALNTLQDILTQISSVEVDYNSKLNKLLKQPDANAAINANITLANAISNIQNFSNTSMNEYDGKVLANMFGHLENRNVLINYINNNGLTNDFLNEAGTDFMSNEDILAKMFDLAYLESIGNRAQSVIMRRQSFVNKINDEIKNIDFTDYIKQVGIITDLYNQEVSNQMQQAEQEDMMTPSQREELVAIKENLDAMAEEYQGLTDDQILNSEEFITFNNSNPNSSIAENLEYYKMCKLIL